MLYLDIGRFCAKFFIATLKDSVLTEIAQIIISLNRIIKLLPIIIGLLVFRHIIKSRHKVTSICQQ